MPKKQKISIRTIIGAIGALSGIASGLFFAYHDKVVSYRPNDIADTFGYWMLTITILCWLIFVVIALIKK